MIVISKPPRVNWIFKLGAPRETGTFRHMTISVGSYKLFKIQIIILLLAGVNDAIAYIFIQ